MKTAAFVIGYAGSILALILALLMIYTVPINFISATIKDVQDDLDNEHILAINEVAIAIRDKNVTDLSEENISKLAKETAAKSVIVEDGEVYEEAVSFVYDAVRHGLLSAFLIGLTIFFALLSFIGALLCKRKPMGGAVLMMVSALIMLLTSIYTGTVIPMISAVLILMIAGIVAFIPAKNKRIPYPEQIGFPQMPYIPQAPAVEPPQEMPIQMVEPAISQMDLPEKDTDRNVPFPDKDIVDSLETADTNENSGKE